MVRVTRQGHAYFNSICQIVGVQGRDRYELKVNDPESSRLGFFFAYENEISGLEGPSPIFEPIVLHYRLILQ